ncbi:hypothetical protein M2368_002450 [Arthrobacter sp. JUb119]|uniref:hypothetical protein n=1 Tax=Micrococcaceae TaxID=1268 RepID=UPI000CFD1D8A|nr:MULTISPECIES: hypothetical protein [unclassified Arthrobacter]MCS3493438.1 hypothetical protein [Arthrobacter sp. JUb119]PQZ86840.1 hypothetical protein CQ016_10320 [Arthrobacter sp. MYb222]TDU24497.1 hypothetical protein EDF61_10749 [Arthrobacter sp. JUb115]
MVTARGLRLIPAGIALGCVSLSLASCATSIGQGPQTQLEITIRDDGSEISQQYSLECTGEQAAESSTLPNASKACLQLELEPGAIAGEVDPQEICTEIYGGPQRAEISGTLHGETVNTSFSRHNGCAIDRWDAASFLLGSVKT